MQQLESTLTLAEEREGEEFLAELAEERPKRRRTSRLGLVVYAVSLVVMVALFADGYSYYTTPFDQRPRHEDYRVLRPAGSRGILYGVAGTVMMLLMLGYSLRKRVKFMRNWLKVPQWLDVHIYFGILGPLFILLHTSFKVNGLVAIAFWSMVIVALSGFVGRYLYRFIPRGIHGNELSLRELNEMHAAIGEQMSVEYRLPEAAVAHLRQIAQFPENKSGLWGTMSALVTTRLRRQKVLRRAIHDICTEYAIPRNREESLTTLARRQWQLQSRLQALEQVRRLFHYWHVAHKPLAVVMYLIVAVHVGVAIWTGYAMM